MAHPPETRSPATRAGQRSALAGGFGGEKSTTYHVDKASAEPLLGRLEAVQKSGAGWRARCPNCGGKSRKLVVTESPERVGVHCFDCHDTPAILAAVGLTWADLFPPRGWPESPEERRHARRAIREAGWSAALSVLALEGRIVLLAARELWYTGGLEVEDGRRLAEAVERIDRAAAVLVEVQR